MNAQRLPETSSVAIRPAVAADAEAVSAVLHASYSVLLADCCDPGLLVAALPMMNRANPRLLACGTYYVAELEGQRIAGCGGWTRERPGTGQCQDGVGHIRHFATDPGFLRRGIGNALMARCIDESESHGIYTLECFSTLTAEAFYAAAGFRTLGRFDVEFPNGVKFPSLHMHRMSKARD